MNSEPTTLVTNDDGIESPLLEPLVKALSDYLPSVKTSFLVPDRERSWISQAVTRREHLEVTEAKIAGLAGHTSTGLPADCVNLAADCFHSQIKLVVSGINVGVNAALPYYLYSGTVGAARAAYLRGIPALALSLSVPEEIYALWNNKDVEGFKKYSERFETICAKAAKLCRQLSRPEYWLSGVSIYSINFPWETEVETEVIYTQLEAGQIGGIFQKRADGKFEHAVKLADLRNEAGGLPGDYSSVKEGKISVNPLFYSGLALSPEEKITELPPL